MSVYPSKCPYVRLSICNINDLLLSYCYINKNLRNLAFVFLFKGIFVVNYKILNCRISGGMIQISGIRPDIWPNSTLNKRYKIFSILPIFYKLDIYTLFLDIIFLVLMLKDKLCPYVRLLFMCMEKRTKQNLTYSYVLKEDSW